MRFWVRNQNKEMITTCEKLYIEQFYDSEVEKEASAAYMSAINKAYNFGSTKAAEIEGEHRKQNVYNRAKIYYSINNEKCKLGSYSSKERAIEILDEMHKLLNEMSGSTVYQMPES